MKLVVDNAVTDLIVQGPLQIAKLPLINEADNSVIFRWPSLLEYLGLSNCISNLSPFDSEQDLFHGTITALSEHEEKETVHYVYDRLFTEILNQIVALPQIHRDSLLQALRQRKSALTEEIAHAILPTLNYYERALVENPAHIMHSLILYLAWDRMCVYMARLFDHHSADAKYIEGTNILKGSLIESFLHITQDGRASPSLFRMLESLFFFYMREENLQKHTPEEWNVFSKGFKVLTSQEKIADVFYIDEAIHAITDIQLHIGFLTTDSTEKSESRIQFSNFILAKIQSEFPDWTYSLHEQKIIHVDVEN